VSLLGLDVGAGGSRAVVTLPKLLWVQRHEPAIWSQVRSVLLLKDYVRWRLTGDRATDVADASGTLLFDVARRCWSEPMLRETDVDPAWLPTVHEGLRSRLCRGEAFTTSTLRAGSWAT
jgi:xylulokinase